MPKGALPSFMGLALVGALVSAPATARGQTPTAAELLRAEALISIDDGLEPAVDWAAAVATSMFLGAAIAGLEPGQSEAQRARLGLIGVRVMSRRITNRVYRRPDRTRACLRTESVHTCLERAAERGLRLRMVDAALNLSVFTAVAATFAAAGRKDGNFVLTLTTTALVTLYDLYPTATERLAARSRRGVASPPAVGLEIRGGTSWGMGLSVAF